MDSLLEEWQEAHLRRPERQPRGGARRAGAMVQDDLVAIDAGQVSITGTPAEVERLATAAGLYPGEPHRQAMSKDEDHILTGVYIGVGILLAAGAGYLAWRYVLDDAQKQRIVNRTKDAVADGMTMGKRAVRDARGKIGV